MAGPSSTPYLPLLFSPRDTSHGERTDGTIAFSAALPISIRRLATVRIVRGTQTPMTSPVAAIDQRIRSRCLGNSEEFRHELVNRTNRPRSRPQCLEAV